MINHGWKKSLRRPLDGRRVISQRANKRELGKAVNQRPACDRGCHTRVVAGQQRRICAPHQMVQQCKGSLARTAIVRLGDVQNGAPPHEIKAPGIIERETDISDALRSDTRAATCVRFGADLLKAIRKVFERDRGGRRQQGFDVRKMMLRGRRRHASAPGNLPQTEAVDTSLGKQVPGGGEKCRSQIAVMIPTRRLDGVKILRHSASMHCKDRAIKVRTLSGNRPSATPTPEVEIMEKVLLTGISGFVGGHVALVLLERGYWVRGTVRNREAGIRASAALAAAGADMSRLDLVELNLLEDKGWQDAAEGCAYTQHIASPFQMVMPKDPDDLILPATHGTAHVLGAALKAKHRRVVLTSSLAAIDGGHLNYKPTLTEDVWTNLEGPHVNAYAESKTRAERLAWGMAENASARDRLVVINPGAILGPLLDDDPGTTGSMIVRLLRGEMPVAPNIILEYVDVRDVAAAHVAAMTAPEAAGRRNILAEQSLSLIEVSAILREAFPSFAQKLPRRALPDWLARGLSLFDASLRDSRAQLGVRKHSNASRGIALVGAPLIPARDAVIAAAQSIIDRKLA